MNIRVNTDGVLNLACAVLLASAVVFSAIGAEATGCFAPRPDHGATVLDIHNGQVCDADESLESGRGRPGMRFLLDVA